MQASKPFTPLGDTIVVPSASTAPAGVQAPVREANKQQAAGNYQIINAGSAVAFVGWGSSAAKATANAVAATEGSPGAGIPVAPGTVVVFTLSESAWFSSYSTSALTLYITPGEGM